MKYKGMNDNMEKSEGNPQRKWEGFGISIFSVILFTGGMYLMWDRGVPFELIVFFMLALINSDTSALWRTYVR